MVNFRDYIRQTQNAQQIPTNVYEHANSLLDGSKTDDVDDLLSLTSRRIKLANVGNDVLLQLEQAEVRCLVDWKDASKRDSVCKNVFDNLYARWVNSLDLTRAKDGRERQEQGKIGTNFQNPYQMGGFGEDLSQYNQNPNDPVNQDPLSRFMNNIGKGKKRR